MDDTVASLVGNWSRQALRALDESNIAVGNDRALALDRARLFRKCAQELAEALKSAPTDRILKTTP